jgi:apolipoprotein N-acyltransferase
VPLLIYAQLTSGKKSFFVAWAGGYVAFALGYSGSPTRCRRALLVAIYMGSGPDLRHVVRRVGVSGRRSCGWRSRCCARRCFSGLPWLLLGYTQHDLL